MSTSTCGDYCEHNAAGLCLCQSCTWLRTEAGFRHADGCPQADVVREYTIYRDLDASELMYTVKEWLITGSERVAGTVLGEEMTLKEARDSVRPFTKHTRFRAPGDAQDIVETWG